MYPSKPKTGFTDGWLGTSITLFADEVKAEDDEALIQEVFPTELVYPQEKRDSTWIQYHNIF